MQDVSYATTPARDPKQCGGGGKSMYQIQATVAMKQ